MIAVRGLAHGYGSSDVLRLAQWQAPQASRWLVLGPSGCGKTTLLHVLAGLIRPRQGEVLINGAALGSLAGAKLDRWRGANVGIVLQGLHLVRHLTVRDNVRLAQYMAHAPQDAANVNDALAALGVADKAERRPAELSEGERQRVAIARAVVNRPKLLLADKPTANLDDVAAARAIDLLMEQAERYGATLVVATHDARVKAKFSEQINLA